MFRAIFYYEFTSIVSDSLKGNKNMDYKTMRDRIEEYEQNEEEKIEVVELPKADWMGESLKHNLINSYFYFDVFKNIFFG